MTVIRQSTARTFLVGPVLDADGVAKTDEVVANIRITKNGTVGSADGSTTLTHDHAGKYKLAMDAGDPDTVGVLEVSLNSGTNDMPVARFNVVEEAVYDALYAASATGFSTHNAAAVKTAMEADGSKLDHLWEMTEDDGGTRRLTTNALEQGPDSDTTTNLTLHSDYNAAKTAAQASDVTTAHSTTDGLIGGLNNFNPANDTVLLADAAMGGSSLVLTLKQLVINNSNGIAVDIDGTTGGVSIAATSTAMGITSSGSTAITIGGGGDGHALSLIGSGQGRGLFAQGGLTDAAGIYTAGGTGGHGLHAVGNGGGDDINGDINGTLAICTTVGSVTTKTGYSLATSEDVYHADIDLAIDEANTQDEYTVSWLKNGVRVTSGITSPTIQVVKRANGTDLVASTPMTQIGSTGSYKYDEASNRVTAGEAVLVIVGATIDGSARSFVRVASRDSSA